MSDNSTLSTKEQRAKRKALLVAKIYAERELISLQAQRIANDVKPSTIKNNLIEGAVAKVQGSKISHGLFSYIERHPRVSLLVAQFLMRGVKKTRYSRSSIWWAPLVIGAATWFVSNRRQEKQSQRHQAESRPKPQPQSQPSYRSKPALRSNPQTLSRTRVRAQSRPVRFVDDGPSPSSTPGMTRREPSQKAPPRKDRRSLRRHMY
ncbi:hypothetical protein OURE66S_03449 [Oligella ureolytica]|jgi:hypothetical protein|nr:hypothetical protein [Oligella sp.]